MKIKDEKVIANIPSSSLHTDQKPVSLESAAVAALVSDLRSMELRKLRISIPQHLSPASSRRSKQCVQMYSLAKNGRMENLVEMSRLKWQS